MGGGRSSSSSNSTTTKTTDKRMVVDGSSIGISSDTSTVTVNALDADIVKKALDTVSAADATAGAGFSQLLTLADKALDTLSAADATAGAGFSQLLTLADKLFTSAGQIIDNTQKTTMAQIEAVNAARADAQGTIDQKTMIVLAAVTAGAVILSRKG